MELANSSDLKMVLLFPGADLVVSGKAYFQPLETVFRAGLNNITLSNIVTKTRTKVRIVSILKN